MIDNILGIVKVTFNGRNGAGPISVPGIRAGGHVLVIWQMTPSPVDLTRDANSFETRITVDDEIQQVTAGNQATFGFEALISGW